ncbi:hypothetical protein EJB05_13129 [Eragrostis curvula]|uniref:Uncharacterized protein n=1 Tax=Eragrostis curvula TaxID=38414 RepID=A0A5J9VVN7_9POAL|nr:hypothetical protein EJB05_13129 [Eragrostis curvula]
MPPVKRAKGKKSYHIESLVSPVKALFYCCATVYCSSVARRFQPFISLARHLGRSCRALLCFGLSPTRIALPLPSPLPDPAMMQPPSSLRAAAITEPSSPMTPCFLRAADPLIGSPPPRLPPASSQVLWDARCDEWQQPSSQYEYLLSNNGNN